MQWTKLVARKRDRYLQLLRRNLEGRWGDRLAVLAADGLLCFPADAGPCLTSSSPATCQGKAFMGSLAACWHMSSALPEPLHAGW
eukprot:362860-Chlamydomonas_euryale.AAC.1